MSKRLLKHKSFLELLLTTDKSQARALMETINKEQAEVIVEIFINLLKLDVPTNTKILLKKRKRLITKIINKRVGISTKLNDIRRHFRQVHDTLLSVKNSLLKLLK